MICNIANCFNKSFIRTHSRSLEFYHLNLICVEAELLVVSGCRGCAPLLPNSEVFCPSQYSQFFLLVADGLCCSAVKQSIGFTIGFHNHGEGPY